MIDARPAARMEEAFKTTTTTSEEEPSFLPCVRRQKIETKERRKPRVETTNAKRETSLSFIHSSFFPSWVVLVVQ